MANQVYSYQEHLVSVDCIVFGYENSELKLLLFKRVLEPMSGEWSLVGGWVNKDESVEGAARRVLYKITGLQDIFLEQVEVFSDPNRDPGGRVISVTFYALIRLDDHDKVLIESYGAKWFSLSELPKLIFDHNQMVDKALQKMRLNASYVLVGQQLLPEKFTILQLRNLYNAIFFREFDPGNFRKKVLSLRVLERLSSKNTKESKKGAFYYRFNQQSAEQGVNLIVKY